MNHEFRSKCASLPTWHPLHTYFLENNKLLDLLKNLESVNPTDDYLLFNNLFNQIAEIEIRYTRKENQLFPFLEKRGWTGPSQGMWSFHDSIRSLLREARKFLSEKDFKTLEGLKIILNEELTRMVEVEEFRLLPYALELLSEEDWIKMSEGESEIGFAFNVSAKSMIPNNPLPVKEISDYFLKLNEGAMDLNQINLMLKFLPIDLTFVDEFDRVRFYNRGEERVFPRSAGVIGREVRFCHPPKSVGTVLEILEAFKNGTKNSAEFWIDYRGKKIYICYYAIRNELNEYKGVIEVSQDITHILTITGEKRLLNWNN